MECILLHGHSCLTSLSHSHTMLLLWPADRPNQLLNVNRVLSCIQGSCCNKYILWSFSICLSPQGAVLWIISYNLWNANGNRFLRQCHGSGQSRSLHNPFHPGCPKIFSTDFLHLSSLFLNILDLDMIWRCQIHILS